MSPLASGRMAPSRPAAEGSAGARRRALPGRLVYAVTAITAAVWFLLDQASKVLAVEALELEGRVLDLRLLDVRVVRNPGGAFSIPGLFPGLFVAVTVVVIVLVVRALPRTDRVWLAFAYGLVSGGAIGNVADRLFRDPGFPTGRVVDFFDLGWWPVFNVADIGIVVGAALIALIMTLVDREERAAQRARAAHRSVRPREGMQVDAWTGRADPAGEQ